VDKPEVNPLFYVPIEYQNAQLHIYPYPYIDKLTDNRVNVSYKALVLENEFTKIVVLPEFGGRIYIAEDKTNGYDFYYHNHVIKPALIGMNGAWLSGGIEWNFPHHHQPGSFLPVNYKLVSHPDGSKTIWVGEYEKRHQMKWTVGMTLYPGKSYLQVDLRTYNVTPVEHSSLFWVNTSVHVNEEYQAIFPEDVNLVTYHTKDKFTTWPVSYDYYDGNDFSKGYDISWWKNTMAPTSFFVYHSDFDFIAGVDHKHNKGTVEVADHYLNPGKKMWNWGNNPIGRLWDKLLTDSDGPYIELMMGSYSDNQPDYIWNGPGQARRSTMYFYPMKEMDYVKNANKEIAVNMQQKEDRLLLQVNTTSVKEGALLTVTSTKGKVFGEKINVGPAQPYSREIPYPAGTDFYDLRMSVSDGDGNEMISYVPVRHVDPEIPEPYRDPGNPEDFKTVEELYLAGLRLEQFGNPYLLPEAYYHEALKRDSLNAAVNTRMGILALERYDYPAAEKYLRRAVNTVTARFTKPRQSDPLYYLGYVLYLQGRYKEAYDLLSLAAWRQGWAAPSYYLLTLMDCRKGEPVKAYDHITRSLNAQAGNPDVWVQKAYILRKTGRAEEAYHALQQALEIDPLSLQAIYELAQLAGVTPTGKTKKEWLDHFRKIMREEPDNYLQTATRYARIEDYGAANGILEMAAASDHDSLSRYPMIHYYRACYYDLAGEKKRSEKAWQKASSLGTEYCFPYGEESRKVLTWAIRKHPADAKAHLYLGDLLCDFQPEEAARQWQEAIRYDDQMSQAWRNLAWVQGNVLNDLPAAISNIRKAIGLKPDDPVYLGDADEYYRLAGAAVDTRYQLIKTHLKGARKSDRSFTPWLALNMMKGNYDLVIREMKNRHFRVAENIARTHHQYWAAAHIMRGRQYMEKGEYEKAIEDFEQALLFPRNLEMMRDGKEYEAYYYMGLTYEKTGGKEKALEAYRHLLEIPRIDAANTWGATDFPEILYYKVLVAKKMGLPKMAEERHLDLLDKSNNYLNYTWNTAWDWRSVARRLKPKETLARGYFSRGLFYLLSGETTRAKEYFRKSLDLLPDYFSAQEFMQIADQMEKKK
jgi:tetratricopeptide (TPR) repeat protein